MWLIVIFIGPKVFETSTITKTVFGLTELRWCRFAFKGEDISALIWEEI